ncbi:MAG TPA: hypothetical protein VHZ76_09295 [Gammaproteobacteria bacterium]|jgi:hypothetical protein|nr:hypothetical protein [Gammaproteobacteria bacterium]
MRKISLFIFISVILSNTVWAKTIHETIIVTANNESALVYLWLKVGVLENGLCVNEYVIQNNPSERLRTGDRLEIDGDMIKRLAGPGKRCASYHFQKENSRTVVSDRFLLESDHAGNYVAALPFTGTAIIS